MLAEAGEIALRWFRSDVIAEDKGGDRGYDPVTIADRDIEQVLRERITAAYPDHEVVGEEAGTQRPARPLPLADRPDRRHQGVRHRFAAVGHVARTARRRAPGGRLDPPAVPRGDVRRHRRAGGVDGAARLTSSAAHPAGRRPRRRRRLLHDADDVHRSGRAGVVRGGEPPRPSRALRRRLLRLRPAGDGPRRRRRSTPGCSPTTSSPRWR